MGLYKCYRCDSYFEVLSCTIDIQGRHHSENDEPSMIHEKGSKYWHKNGKLHREDGPACEYSNGAKHWYLNGKEHREDGPACEHSNGTKYWYLNGKRHREDGPAFEFSDGSKHWYLNGEEAIQIPKQELFIQKVIQIENKIGIVLEKITDNIWKVLFGDEKKLVVSLDKYKGVR